MHFDTFTFFNKGYTWGFVPKDVYELARNEIVNTTFVGDVPEYAEWNKLPLNDDDDQFYYEIIREKMTLDRTPASFKYIGELLIQNTYFDPLRKRLVKPQHQEFPWMRSIVPNGYGMWNKTEHLSWHNDTMDGNHLLILMYFNDHWEESYGGQIHIGVEDDGGNIDCVYSHKPIDQSMICINNMNPYFYHRVDECLEDRYTLSFRYRFV